MPGIHGRPSGPRHPRQGVEERAAVSALVTGEQPSPLLPSAYGDRVPQGGLRLSPSQIVRLQGSAGNRAVTRLLALGTTTDELVPAAEPGGSIQRKGKSAELLKKLATPQIFEAPNVELQDNIVDALETVAISHGAAPAGSSEGGKYIPEILLGGIVLDRIPRDEEEEEELIKSAPLIELAKGEHSLGYGAGVTAEWFKWVQEAGVERWVVENTLRTVIKAEQMEYLRKSGFAGKGWRVLLEVHYVRSRPKHMTGFHKDTLGETLFVNLSFNVAQEFAGPEYIMNPPLVPEHEQKIEKSLPKGFMDDLKELRKGPQGDVIEAPKVPGHHVVAFVDEAIHHATPHQGHRALKAEDLEKFLSEHMGAKDLEMFMRKRFGDDLFTKYDTAYERYNAQWVRAFPYSSYLDSKLKVQASQWYERLEIVKEKAPSFTRPKLEKAGLTTGEVDLLLEELGHFGEFRRVGIPDPASRGSPFRGPLHGDDRGPLKRRMSMHAEQGALPKPITGARSFFRTWVRVQEVK